MVDGKEILATSILCLLMIALVMLAAKTLVDLNHGQEWKNLPECSDQITSNCWESTR